MGQVVNQDFNSWIEGVNNSAQPDDLGPNMFSRGINTQITNISAGKAVVARRPMIKALTELAFTNNPAVRSLYHLTLSNTELLLAVCSDRSLWKNDLATPIVGNTLVSGTAVASDVLPQSWSTAKNTAFFTNGVTQFSYNGTTLGGWGLTRPTVGTMAGAAGVAGLHNGTYELRVTFGISALDVESSASNTATATVTLANQQMNWTNIPTSADSRVDRRYLYIRNTATMTNFYLAGTINDNATTTASTGVTGTGLADASMLIIAPSTTENEPPPTTGKYSVWHKNRMFVATDSVVYWSNLNAPTEFNLLQNYVNPNITDGEKIIGLTVHNDALVIFKERSVYVIVGDDPNSWSIRQLFNQVGCISAPSILSVEGVLYWWSAEGPMAWSGEENPVNIGKPYMDAILKRYFVSVQPTHDVVGSIDFDGQRILWHLTGELERDTTGVVTTRVYTLPFNYRIGKWEASYWTLGNIRASVYVKNPLYQLNTLYFGDSYGHLVYLSTSTDKDYRNEHVILGPKYLQTTGTKVVSGSSLTITGTFDSSLDYKGARVSFYDSVGKYMGSRMIVSNNTTTATLDGYVGPTEGMPNGTYSWVVDGNCVLFELPWWDFGEAFKKKWLRYVYTLADGMSISYPMKLMVYADGESAPRYNTTLDLANTTMMDPNRTRIDLNGRTFLVSYVDSGYVAERPLFMQVSALAEILTDKLG